MNLRPYPRYKPSGMDWLGHVPEHWEVRQLRYLCRMRSGEGITSDILSDDAKYPVFGGNGIRGYTSQFTHDGTYLLVGRQGALCGNINYAKGRFWASEHAVVVAANHDTDIHWLGELLRMMNLNQYSIAAAQPGLAVEEIKSLRVPLPAFQEQRDIGTFLQTASARIDTLIGRNRVLIEKLQEKRSALISRVVTRGLPPEAANTAGLNPHPKLKSCGIDWIGEIPEHWSSTKLGFLASKVGSGKTPRGGAETYQSDGILLIRSQNVYEDGLRLADPAFIDKSVDEEMSGTRVQPHDVLLNITGASLGRCAVVPNDFPKANVNQHVCIVRVNPSKLAPRFLHKVICSTSVQCQIFSFENGSSREGLNFHQVRGLSFALPCLQEQYAIAQFLDYETAKLGRMIEKIEDAINFLQEYRTALITAAVTGKIDVREAIPVNEPTALVAAG